MKKIERLLFTNDYDYTALWPDYVDDMLANCPEKAEGLPERYEDADLKASKDFYTWIDGLAQDEYVCFMQDLKYCDGCGRPVVITGTVGRWDGPHEIVPCRMPNIESAVRKCLEGAELAEARQIGSAIEVAASHHDGVNKFVIKFLNAKGISTINGNLANKRYHQALKKCIVD